MTQTPPIHSGFEIAPHSSPAARTAAIQGTRALVADTTLDALLSLLILSGAVPKERASAMLTDVADQLTAYREAGHAEWQLHPAELALQSERLRRQAEKIAS